MDVKLIKNRVYELCKQKEWSYYRLAKEAELSGSTIKYIVDEKHLPSLYIIEKICTAFDISIFDFFNDKAFYGENNVRTSFISLWGELSNVDKEKVLSYMYGLAHKNL